MTILYALLVLLVTMLATTIRSLHDLTILIVIHVRNSFCEIRKLSMIRKKN